MNGKKTYLTILIAVLYVLGAKLGFYALDAGIMALIGSAAVLFLRTSIADLNRPDAPASTVPGATLPNHR